MRNKNNCIFNWRYFKSARESFKYVLKKCISEGSNKILIPAYIGHSSREGSGVFDPIKEIGLDYVFYHLDKYLNINISDLEDKIIRNPKSIILFIHYFGFKDINLHKIKSLVNAKNLIVIEDFAHSFFTFWQNPIVNFDYAFFSLHKLFPLPYGGMLLSKDKVYIENDDEIEKDLAPKLFQFNIKNIVDKRVDNFNYLLNIVKDLENKNIIKILKTELVDNVPQTFPILFGNKNIRDYLYFKLNERGLGVVSLYHELINEINSNFVIEHNISNTIINLPLHQDIEFEDLAKLKECLISTYFEFTSI